MPTTEVAASVGVWLWACAALAALLLLGLNSFVASLDGGRDGGVRLFRMLVYLLVVALLFIPALLLAVTYPGVGYGLLAYVLLFSGFCYYAGKRLGWRAGRKHISELVGIDTPDRMEEVQDRLFESNMRLPARAQVVNSIGEMAKQREAEQRERERAGVGRPADTQPSPPPPAAKAKPRDWGK